MRKSVPSFILGLVLSLVGMGSALAFSYVFLLIGAIAGGSVGTVVEIATLVNIATFVISFVGSFFCFKKAHVGGILMIIASLLSFGCLAAIFVALKTFTAVVLWFWIPSLVILLTGAMALTTKKQNVLI